MKHKKIVKFNTKKKGKTEKTLELNTIGPRQV